MVPGEAAASNTSRVGDPQVSVVTCLDPWCRSRMPCELPELALADAAVQANTRNDVCGRCCVQRHGVLPSGNQPQPKWCINLPPCMHHDHSHPLPAKTPIPGSQSLEPRKCGCGNYFQALLLVRSCRASTGSISHARCTSHLTYRKCAMPLMHRFLTITIICLRWRRRTTSQPASRHGLHPSAHSL